MPHFPENTAGYRPLPPRIWPLLDLDIYTPLSLKQVWETPPSEPVVFPVSSRGRSFQTIRGRPVSPKVLCDHRRTPSPHPTINIQFDLFLPGGQRHLQIPQRLDIQLEAELNFSWPSWRSPSRSPRIRITQSSEYMPFRSTPADDHMVERHKNAFIPAGTPAPVPGSPPGHQPHTSL